jgi:protein-S-isoprenylcysteine O-methyltransferase Ste14
VDRLRLSDHLEASGNWLFRWRSYLPLLLMGGLLASLREFKYPGGSRSLDVVWELVSALVGLLGVGIRAYAVGCAAQRTSGRNTREQIADSLNTTGLYSIMRHPLYFGNTLMWFSAALFAESWSMAVIILLVSALYHERIIFAEEAFLERKFGETFRNWSARTPAAWPKFSLWQPPLLPFAWRHALQREYLGLFALITTFFALDIASDWFCLHRIEFDPLWLSAWLVGLVMFAVVRFLRKRTGLLAVAGR